MNQTINPPLNNAPIRVMLIDDVQESLNLMRTMLLRHGCEVLAVSTGAQGLRAVEDTRPDLVLLDIKMPDMDGYEVCRQLKANPRLTDIPVIFLSALHAIEDKVKGFQAGGVDFVTKPFKFVEIRARIDAQIKLHRLQLQLERTNQALVQALAKAESANRVKSEFLSGLSDQIGGPMQEILAAANQALESGLNPAQRGYLEKIQNNSQDLLELIDQTLTLNRASA